MLNGSLSITCELVTFRQNVCPSVSYSSESTKCRLNWFIAKTNPPTSRAGMR